jgi:hypothetical protein
MKTLMGMLLASTMFVGSASADTLTVAYYNPAESGLGLQTLSSQGGALPNISFGPIFLGTSLPSNQWFGFGNISALLTPTSPGNQVPNFEFAFHDGFVPQTGGTIYLFATWTSVNLSNKAITMPTTFATDEMPGGANGLYVAEQIFTGPPGALYCDNFLNPCGHFAGGTQFTDTLATQHITLTTIAPGATFSITEEFVFGNNASWNGIVQGDVGAYMITTPLAHVPVPGPIVGAGLPGLITALLGFLGWRKRRYGRWLPGFAGRVIA